MALNRESVIRAAEKYVSRGKLEAGIKEYRKVLAENPNDANTLNRVGDLYARIERFDEAVKLFTQIAEQYTRDGFFVKAIAIYKKIIKLNPSSLQVYERLAELYFKQGLLNEARTQYQVLADYYQKHDNAASAITIFQKMSEIEPENPTFHLKLAELYESQRLTDKALASYRQLADLLLVGGSVEEAAQVFLRALEIGSDDLEFIRSTVAGLHEGGHVGAAAKVLARAVEANPQAAGIAEEIGLAEGQPTAELEIEEEADDDEAGFADGEGAGFADVGAAGLEDVAEPLEAVPDFGDFQEVDTPDGDDTDATVAISSEATFADLEAEARAADAASFATDSAEDEEIEVFTLDLEDDEIPDTLVAPPPDMLEPVEAEDDEEAPDFGPALEDLESVSDAALDLDDDPLAAEEEEPSIELDLSEFDLTEIENTPLTDVESPAPVADVEAPALEDVEASALEDLEATVFADVEATAPADVDTPALADVEAPALEEVDTEPDGAAASATEEAEVSPVAAGFELSIDLDDLEDDDEPSKISLAESVPTPAAFELADESPPPVEAEPTELELPALEDAAEDSGLDEIELEVEPTESAPLEAVALEEAEPETAGPPSIRREEDLLAEAKVFAKYGLEEKALDRLGELLELQPSHVEGLVLKTRIFFEAGRHQDAQAAANEVARVAQEVGDLDPWRELRDDLIDAGYAIEDEQVLDEPLQKPLDEDRIAQLLEDLSLDDFDSTSLAPLDDTNPVPAAEIPPPIEMETPAVASDTPAPTPLDAEPKPKRKLVSLVEELGLEDLQDDAEDVPAVDETPAVAEVAEPTAEAAAADLDETGMSWLDDVATNDEAAAVRDEALFEEEDDFFDLAAELERELTEDDLADGVVVQPQEQSLEEIIEGFKQGVAENLSAEDYETHFNLGIAYREMGLLDEAISEFQLASKDERYLVDCSSLLGVCFLEKGLPELAVRWYRKGLEAPSINDEATAGLLYDMGNAYISLGDSEAASKTFIEVYGLNSNYRDVSAKLEELGAVP